MIEAPILNDLSNNSINSDHSTKSSIISGYGTRRQMHFFQQKYTNPMLKHWLLHLQTMFVNLLSGSPGKSQEQNYIQNR